MPDGATRFDTLPARPGVGYKPQHFKDLQDDPGPVEWIEIHAENYMGDGGRPLAQLRALSEKFALSVHGVGLSIGGEMPLDRDHLARLKKLCDWANPASFSEHLAWSTHDSEFLNDLLPLPYTEATLSRVADHISQVQDTIGRQMLLENPSSYLAFDESTLSETDFLAELTHRTSCGVGFNQPLLIDSHSRPVVDPVWDLLAYTLDRTGPKPVLVEWDNDVPDWPTLRAEAERAADVLAR
jgi:uncharacterized protein (UPF0276 family)